jgi:hypothetical protein
MAAATALGTIPLQSLFEHPWVQAVVTGGLLGLIGASLFIILSWLLHHLAEERRSRTSLIRCGLLDSEKAPDTPLESADLEAPEPTRVFRL